ncbi:MAG TPA: hypothetical protein VF070_32940 [Streptosporangiaceae bacterium]
MDSLSLALLQVDWGSLDHAYGPAADAPGQLLALVGDDPEARSGAVGYLDAAMLHQGTVCSATAPFITIVAMLLGDTRTAVPVADILPWDRDPRPLRVALLEYLTVFAQACRLDTPEEDLLRDAYPAGREEADLQRIYRARRDCDWQLDPNPATRQPPPPAVLEAVNDQEYHRAMRARPLLACRKVVPGVFEAVLPLITGSDPAVRTPAMTTAAYCLGHPALRERKDALAELLTDTAAVTPDPAERAAVARLLALLGTRPEALLRDEHPGVRACAALAPEFSGDERATRELVSALTAPKDADRWFSRHLPGQEGWLHCDLAEALAARTSDLEAVLPAALGLAASSNPFIYERDLAPFVRLAFPQALTERTVLTPAQRAFLGALLPNGHHPFDQALCQTLLGT